MIMPETVPMGSLQNTPPPQTSSTVSHHSVRKRIEPEGRELRGLRRADALIASGKLDKALAHLRRLNTSFPGSTRVPLRIAALLRETRRPAEALAVLRNAVRRTPQLTAPREALAEMCLEVGRWEEAIHECQVLLSLAPRSLPARDVLSAAYLQRGLIEKALQVTEEMITLDPHDAAHHFKRGVLLQQQGMVGPALREFQRVLQMDADGEAADEARAAIEMLDTFQLRQIITLAVEDIPFRLNLREDPSYAITSRGYYLSERGIATLAQLRFEETTLPRPGWRHYRYQ